MDEKDATLAKITSFFQSLPKGTPLPFRWTPSGDPHKKRIPGRPRKIRVDSPDISIRSEEAATTHSVGKDEEQKKRVVGLWVGLANAKSVAAAVEHDA